MIPETEENGIYKVPTVFLSEVEELQVKTSTSMNKAKE